MKQSVPFGQTRASVHLDALRAMAAVVVATSHWRALMFVDYAQEPNHSLKTKAFYLLTQGGHTSVVVFFVLSGYLIAGSIFRGLERGSFSFSLYLTHRLARLWTVLIPALVIGGLLDVAGLHHTAAHALYTGHVLNHTSGNVAANLNWTFAWRDAMFLQRNTEQNFGSNTPLWSLSYEFWYYILFPLCLLLGIAGSRTKKLLLSVALLITATISGVQILLLFPLWLSGASLHKIPHRAFRHQDRVIAAALFVVCFIGHSQGSRHLTTQIGEWTLDLLMAFATVAFLWVLLSSSCAADPQSFYLRLSRSFASFSYTLYAVHFPALLLFTALIVGDTRWLLTARHLGATGACLILTVGWAALLYWLLERRTAAVQSILFRPISYFEREARPSS